MSTMSCVYLRERERQNRKEGDGYDTKQKRYKRYYCGRTGTLDSWVPDMVFYFRLTLFESSLFSGLIVIFVKWEDWSRSLPSSLPALHIHDWDNQTFI